MAPQVQAILQPQPRNTTQSKVHPKLEPPTEIPPNSIMSTISRLPLRPSEYKAPICREPILPPPPPKPLDMAIYSITLVYQLPRIKDEPIDIDAIGPQSNTEFMENAPEKEGNTHEVYGRLGKKYL